MLTLSANNRDSVFSLLPAHTFYGYISQCQLFNLCPSLSLYPSFHCLSVRPQYFVNGSQVAVKVRDILPDEDLSTITNLLASSDGEYIYALTPKKVRPLSS